MKTKNTFSTLPIAKEIEEKIAEFVKEFSPIESDVMLVFKDNCTNAVFIECHIQADKLLNNSTIDVPLDPDNQSDYRANRDVVDDHAAFIKMKSDAESKRAFSNLVAEYSTNYNKSCPLKIIGGQHRYLAIKEAFEKSINEYHGVKVYFSLDKTQRLDVQLISNTNIAVSSDLLDRMSETVKGPELRNWCQSIGLLEAKEDFSDKKERGGNITVRGARSFILSYCEGRKYKTEGYEKINPEPILAKTGDTDERWEVFRANNLQFLEDNDLIKAGKAFAELNRAQYDAIEKKARSLEFAEKALSYAVLTSWAYIAGLLYSNEERLKRHFSLKNQKNTDPLNTNALSKGKHKTDPENYRGLGARTDLKERGRLAELFFMQTARGDGITVALVDAAIKGYHAKLAVLEAEEARKKAEVK